MNLPAVHKQIKLVGAVQAAHARLSPSGSKRWLSCPGSIKLEEAFPNTSSTYADDGTCCHIVAAECLRDNLIPSDWLGDLVTVSDPGEEKRTVEFTDDLCAMTTAYVDAIRERSAGCELHVEQRLSFSEFVDVLDDQFGTIDAHWLCSLTAPEEQTLVEIFEIVICDLKTGFKWVDTDSPQLLIYALAVLALYELSHDITQVRLMIFAPRHGGMREQVISVAELREFAVKLKEGARLVELASARYEPNMSRGDEAIWARTYLNPNPNEDDCAFCRAMSTCPSARGKLEREVGVEFDVIAELDPVGPIDLIASVPAYDSGTLSRAMAATGLLEDWIKAVRAETERRLLLGEPVEGYGLELGRQGARAWKDAEEAERMVRKQFRIKMEDAYKMVLKSPTQMEKLAEVKTPNKRNPNPPAPLMTPIQWSKLAALIKRSDAVPSVKPVSQIKTPYEISKPDENAFEAIEPVLPPPADEAEPDQLW